MLKVSDNVRWLTNPSLVSRTQPALMMRLELCVWSQSEEKLLKEFEDSVFPTKKEGRLFMDQYLKKV